LRGPGVSKRCFKTPKRYSKILKHPTTFLNKFKMFIIRGGFLREEIIFDEGMKLIPKSWWQKEAEQVALASIVVYWRQGRQLVVFQR
jgi:hypothetical protein